MKLSKNAEARNKRTKGKRQGVSAEKKGRANYVSGAGQKRHNIK